MYKRQLQMDQRAHITTRTTEMMRFLKYLYPLQGLEMISPFARLVEVLQYGCCKNGFGRLP